MNCGHWTVWKQKQCICVKYLALLPSVSFTLIFYCKVCWNHEIEYKLTSKFYHFNSLTTTMT